MASQVQSCRAGARRAGFRPHGREGITLAHSHASILAAGAALLLTACGGGGPGPNVQLSGGGQGGAGTTALSADQKLFESFTLSPGTAYRLFYDLPFSGRPVAGTSYVADAGITLALSPLSHGPRQVQYSALAPLAGTLGLPGDAAAPQRYLVNGLIYVGSEPSSIIQYSYVNTAVRTDLMAADGRTAVASHLLSGFSAATLAPLTPLALTPAALGNWLGPITFNQAVLARPGAAWPSGAGYLQYTETNLADTCLVYDNDGTSPTFGNSPTPVGYGTTLAALMASGGITSSDDTRTYTLANGAVSTLNGVVTYVATAVRPNLTTPAYRTYYQLNGNVYAGELIRAGTVIGGMVYATGAPPNPVFHFSSNVQLQLNQAAVDGLAAFLAF
jgi:hypothetical protein